MDKIDKFLDQCLGRISKLQNQDGGFHSLSLPADNPKKNTIRYKTVFHPALILGLLSDIENDTADAIKSRITKFLLKQKSLDWSFNYWVKNTKEYQKHRIPDDMDDGSVAMASLYKYDKGIFSAKDMAIITSMLTNHEICEGGPYQTWLIQNPDDKKWLDADIAVNANIAYFLYLLEIELPNLTHFFEKKIAANKLQSKYYPDSIVTVYYLSKFYRGKQLPKLLKILGERRKLKGNENILNTAMTISAMINFGQVKKGVDLLNKDVEYLMTITGESSGREPFCLDPMIDKQIRYSASLALTLAFVVEAVNKFKKTLCQGKAMRFNCGEKTKNSSEQEKFIIKVHQRFLENNKKFQDRRIEKILQKFLQKIIKRDVDNEILLIAHEYQKSVSDKIDAKLSQELALANLYGWIAYTIYDDLMDGEGQALLLPIANLCLLQTINIFKNLEKNYHIAGVSKLFISTMYRMERANFQELASSRFDVGEKISRRDLGKMPNIVQIAQKSLPHILGPMIMEMRYSHRARRLKKLEHVLTNYLVARQLNDDAHDIIDDLQKGHLSYAGQITLRDYFKKYDRFDISSRPDLDKLQMVLWTISIKKISKQIKNMATKALDVLKSMNLKRNYCFLEDKLVKLSMAAERAVAESEEARDFITEF